MFYLDALLHHKLLLPVLGDQTVQRGLERLYLRDHLGGTDCSQAVTLLTLSLTSDRWISFSFFCISKSEVLLSISFVLEIKHLN